MQEILKNITKYNRKNFTKRFVVAAWTIPKLPQREIKKFCRLVVGFMKLKKNLFALGVEHCSFIILI